MKTVIEKGIKNLTPLKDQERIIVRRAFSLSLTVSHFSICNDVGRITIRHT